MNRVTYGEILGTKFVPSVRALRMKLGCTFLLQEAGTFFAVSLLGGVHR